MQIKSIHINLSRFSNKFKLQKLSEIFSLIEKVNEEYLIIKKTDLETKQFHDQNKIYAEFRIKYPELNSAILQQIFKHVDSTIKSYISWCKKKHKLVGFPEKISPILVLRNDCFKIKLSTISKHFEYWFSLTKIKFPIKLNNYTKSIIDKSVGFSDSRIIKDEFGNFILNLSCKIETSKINIESNKLGIDLGIKHPIICSDNKIIGNGKFVLHKKKEFNKQRGKAQKNKKEIISKKQSNFTKDVNHKLSKQLIDYTISQGIDVLVLEKLSGQSLSNKKFRKIPWAFKQLLNFIEYKAECAGIKIVRVNPAYTSQTCSCCGFESKDNRINQSKFVCQKCGFKINADFNGARNIKKFSFLDGLMMTQPTVKL